MTVEEMQARIEQLEKENAKLRGEKGRLTKVVPDELESKYPWLDKDRDNVASPIGKAVRALCFPKSKKPHMRNWGQWGKSMMDYTYLRSVREMSDEEYEKYSLVFRAVVEAIAPYRYCEDDE